MTRSGPYPHTAATMFTWVCDIPGASATTSTLHFALHASLAVFVLVAGVAFLALAFVAYRRSAPGDPLTHALASAAPATD